MGMGMGKLNNSSVRVRVGVGELAHCGSFSYFRAAPLINNPPRSGCVHAELPLRAHNTCPCSPLSFSARCFHRFTALVWLSPPFAPLRLFPPFSTCALVHSLCCSALAVHWPYTDSCAFFSLHQRPSDTTRGSPCTTAFLEANQLDVRGLIIPATITSYALSFPRYPLFSEQIERTD